MNSRRLMLAFKGQRSYVHGTSMFDETIRLLSDAGYDQLTDIEFFIHKMTGKNLELVVFPGNKNGAPECDDIAIMRFVVDGQPMHALVRPIDGVPDLRVLYDESLVVERCEIDRAARSIRLELDDSGFSPIEVLVAMNKALHLNVLEEHENTSWVFCRWDSPSWPLADNLKGISVSLRQTLGTRLTRSDVMLNGQRLGKIYFSAKAAG